MRKKHSVLTIAQASVFFLSLPLALSGCGFTEGVRFVRALPKNALTLLKSDSVVEVTSGFSEKPLFSIETMDCSVSEYLVCLVDMQKRCEMGFTDELWSGEQGEALVKKIKENALAKMSRIKTMVLLAGEHGIELDEEEKERAQAAADEWSLMLTDADVAAMGNVTRDTLEAMAIEYMLSDKVYRYLIRDIDPEISDDEARRVTLRQIALYPGEGEDSRGLMMQANEIYRELENGADFDTLAALYNEAEHTELTFGRDEVDDELEDAAFSLSTGEISRPVETRDGIYILKLINVGDPKETDLNKASIVENRRMEVFGEEYDRFASSLARSMDEEIYDTLDISRDPAVTASGFFDACEAVFSD